MSLSLLKKEFSFSPKGLWLEFFQQESEKLYFKNLLEEVLQQYQQEIVYPSKNLVFKAFDLTPFESLKGVVLGQDPYHNKDQASGLSFSVPATQKIPPSLKNIFKEIDRCYNIKHSAGDLSHWALQGVFMLNTILTVKEHSPLSHKKLGWKTLTDNLLSFIAHHHKGAFFLLWGLEAHKKTPLINLPKHAIIETKHPSPLAGKGFFGSNCFVLANDFLEKNKMEKIDW